MGLSSSKTPQQATTVELPKLIAKLGQGCMGGKTVAITGCTSGTGLVLAKTCAELGAVVVMLNRPSTRADKALEQVRAISPSARFVPCDLSTFESTRAAAAALRASDLATTGLDVLCNNAGVMGLPDTATTDGFDVQMQCNHLSHFLLVSEVWPLLETAAQQRGQARVVQHSSGARKYAKFNPRYLKPNGGKLGGDGWPGYAKWERYNQSKLANLLFAYALSTHIATERPNFKDKILSLCAHPGPAATGLQEKTVGAGGTYLIDTIIIQSVLRIAQTTEDGSCGITRACCDPAARDMDFYGPAKRVGEAVVLPPERNPEAEAVLWSESLLATGVKAFFPS